VKPLVRQLAAAFIFIGFSKAAEKAAALQGALCAHLSKNYATLSAGACISLK
jgi:hypothetical protein